MKKQTPLTLGLLLLIFFSTCIIIPSSAQEEPPEDPPQDPPFVEGFNGTLVRWDQQQEVFEDSWSWLSQSWEFGPYPTFAMFLQNSTEVVDTNFIPLGELFKVVINVKKTIFTENTTLGRAGVHWNTQLRSENGTEIGMANCRMVYTNEISTPYWNESDTWHIESFVFNQSNVMAPPEEPPPPPQEDLNFYNFSQELSNINETANAWTIEIVGSFDNETSPVGPFWVNLEITDSKDTWIDFGYAAWEGRASPNRMVAVGKPGLISGGFRDNWTFEKIDLENNSIYSVSRGTPWKMRLNVTSSSLKNATIGFELPWEVKTFVNVTGWYDVTVIENGGWIFNETSGTYIWNSTFPVTRIKQVYGPHFEERWTHFDHGHEINVTRQFWDPETQEERLENFTEWVQDKMFLIYDQSSHNFSVKQGYSYWSYDPALQRDRDYTAFYPLNTSDPTTQFYNLSINDCSWSQLAPDQYTVEFVGSFSNTTYSGRNEFWIHEPMVYNAYDRIWPDWESINPSNFQIGIDTLVAITTIIDKNGREIKDWMFQTDSDDSFIIQSKLQGGGVSYNDIDGIGVVFRTGWGNWVSENESYWSDVEIRLVNDFSDGQLRSTTYNRTCKNIYVIEPHRGWELVNITDWYQELNATTGTWEWVEGTRLMWNETIVTDWHWEYLSLNQTEYEMNSSSPNAWINRDELWIPDDDPAFLMNQSYATLNSATISLDDGVVTTRLNITFTEDAPNINYWWDMCFMNFTYSRDWSQGWGEHTVLEWTSDSIYYIKGTTTGGNPWYVNEPTTPLYIMYNGTKYTLEETPYITIGEEELLLKARTHFDHGRGEDTTEYLFWGQYDPILGTEPKFYELLNGTEIIVDEAYRAIIRKIKLNTTQVYRITDTGKIPIPNGTEFNTFMDHAEEDWTKEYWNETLQQYIVPFCYELLNGTRIYTDTGFETQIYNWTTDHWELSDSLYTENQTTIIVNQLGQGVTLNKTTLILLADYSSWWQPILGGEGFFLITRNGTIITHQDPWSVPDEQRFVTFNGKNYTVNWPDEYFQGTYLNQSLTIKRNYVHNYYYTNLGISGGTKHELPYPSALAISWWDLERIESHGGRLSTLKSVKINGTKYSLYTSEDGKNYVLINGNYTEVTPPMRDIGYLYSEINGDEYWNIQQGGWILRIGAFSERSGQFTPTGPQLTTVTGYEPQARRWSENNRWGYDWENATLYITAPNGTRNDIHSEMYITVWEVEIDSVIYYTMEPWERWEDVFIPETGEFVQQSFITTLNGTKIYFTWDTNPPSWMDELHIQIPGTNYTNIVPYNWAMEKLFDTIYIFNITIPGMQPNFTHTEVYYEDGSEVPVNSTFKVFGTHWGPGTRHNYMWNMDQWSSNGAFIPGIEAPWNQSLQVQYFTALNGTRIYSEQNFGWMGDHWGDPELGQVRQWDYNTDVTSGNKTVNVVEGGYSIYLNDTIRIEVTSESPQGGFPDQYLIMENGTYLTVHWFDNLYVTHLNNKTYYFRQVVTYYNLTDSGTVYSIADPMQNDPYSILTPTDYLAPIVDPNQMNWVLMNATTDMVLQDVQGHYLVNASDGKRLNLTLVNSWWTLPENIRKSTFRNVWELEDAYPRYNVTIGGQEYFVLDPSPVLGRWDGEHCIEWNTQRYPKSFTVDLNGENYTIILFDGAFWNPELRVKRIETITLNGTAHEVEDQFSWKPYYTVTISNQSNEIKLEQMNIYKKHTLWGEVYHWMLTNLEVTSLRSTMDIIVGAPEHGMWGMRAFSIVPETGAVDLDGDPETGDDQYFVRRVHTGSDTWNRTEDRMFVESVWDPNASLMGDEIHVGAWMGKVHTEWSFTWNETYAWYYASNMSAVSTGTMQHINATLIDSESGMPNPGYWDIAHMAKNQTWADLLNQAQKEGWDWVQDNKHEWDWLWFGTEQNYMTAWTDENGTKTAGIGLQYEFAGLRLYNGSEQTHFFMPENVSSISFVSPGESFGNMNATGELIAPLNETITFGVSFENIEGTLFPFQDDRSMWGWWDGMVHGADFDQPNFMNKPTKTVMDELAFTIHFSSNTTESVETNTASMKVDQYIGNWDIEPFVIDGRKQTVNNVSTYLTGNEVFLDRSLAIDYYVTAFTDLAWNVMDERGETLENDNVTESSTFDVASALANASFASVRLGSTYDWYKPISANDTIRTFNVSSRTTPIGSFEASFESDAGKSSAGFDISAMMYFLTVEFEKWDGYEVYNDPELVFYAYAGEPAASDTTPPEIEEPIREPSGDVLSGQPVKISANITDDDSGVKNATLSYNINDVSWTNATMIYNSTTGLYEATIPGQPAGTSVKYMIIAYDNAGNSAARDNAGDYYIYGIIPEFPFHPMLLLFAALTLLVAISKLTTTKRDGKTPISSQPESGITV